MLNSNQCSDYTMNDPIAIFLVNLLNKNKKNYLVYVRVNSFYFFNLDRKMNRFLQKYTISKIKTRAIFLFGIIKRYIEIGMCLYEK